MKSKFIHTLSSYLVIIFSTNFLVSIKAFAYPEMIRHGYVNCTACHIAPSGGGILSDYGRELSGALLSHWAQDGEQKPLYGVVTPPTWLKLGGDYRYAYVYRDTPAFSDGRSIQMQADAEAAILISKWIIDISTGYKEVKNSTRFSDAFVSRNHWLGYQASEKWTIRAGKFLPTYGIRIPDHETTIRRGIGFNQGTESYNIEASYLSDDWNFFATGIAGQLGDTKSISEKGTTISGSKALSDSSRLGMSFLQGKTKSRSRFLLGPNLIIGFGPKLYLLSEFDFVRTYATTTSTNTSGLLNYGKLGYEPTQGLIVFLTQEWARSNWHSPGGDFSGYSLGVQVFPRPHFEFNLAWQKQKPVRELSGWNDYAFLMAHYYF